MRNSLSLKKTAPIIYAMVDVALRMVQRCTVDAIAHRNVFFKDPSLVLVEEEFRSRGYEDREGREVQRKREPREGLSPLSWPRHAHKSRRDGRRAKFMNLEPRFCPPTRFERCPRGWRSVGD